MNKELLEAAGVDYAAGLRRFAGKSEMYERFIRSFPADENFAEAEALFAQGNYAELLRPVHALKGVSGNLSLTAYYENCCAIVTALRAGNYSEVQALWPENVRLYKKITAVIAKMD